jgi:hypothetical protein
MKAILPPRCVHISVAPLWPAPLQRYPRNPPQQAGLLSKSFSASPFGLVDAKTKYPREGNAKPSMSTRKKKLYLAGEETPRMIAASSKHEPSQDLATQRDASGFTTVPVFTRLPTAGPGPNYR